MRYESRLQVSGYTGFRSQVSLENSRKLQKWLDIAKVQPIISVRPET